MQFSWDDDKYYFIGGYYSPENLIIIVMFNDFLNFLMYQSCNKKLYLPITAGMPKYKGNIWACQSACFCCFISIF